MAIAPSNGKTVLVTGLNGYIAGVLGLHLLQKGYSVRGTSRRAASSEALLKGPYAPYEDRVNIYEVPDMTVEGAFDEAVKGVHGIFHTASPATLSITNFEEMVNPAVKGTETLLDSALRAGPQLTSVVITSSTMAVVNPVEGEYVFTESDFASSALEKAIQNRDAGVTSPAVVLYMASKTAADRAVWKWRGVHKPAFAITTINPSAVLGPPAVLPSSGSALNVTVKPVFDVFSGALEKVPASAGTGSFIDVRNVAFMHIWAYENSSIADGERYLGVQGFGPMQAIADILNETYKGTAIGEKITKGTPGEGYVGFNEAAGNVDRIESAPGMKKVSGEKARRVMGLEYISLQQSVVDTAKALEPLL